MTTTSQFINDKALELEFNNSANLIKTLRRKVFFLKENKLLKDQELISRYKSSRSLNDFLGANYYRVVSNMVKISLEPKMAELFPRFTSEVIIKKDGDSRVFYSAKINDTTRRNWDNGRQLAAAFTAPYNNFRNQNPEFNHRFETYYLQRTSELALYFDYRDSGLIDGTLFLSEIFAQLTPIAQIFNTEVDRIFN